MNIKTARIYEENKEAGAYRFLVDRLWPRGISKEKAGLEDWLKDWAPSNDLRKWFDHEPEKWTEFKKKYHEELDQKQEAIKNYIDGLDKRKSILFLYASKNKEYNHANVLKSYVERLAS